MIIIQTLLSTLYRPSEPREADIRELTHMINQCNGSVKAKVEPLPI